MKIAVLADPIDLQSAGIHVFTKEMVRAMVSVNPGHELLLIKAERSSSNNDCREIVLPQSSFNSFYRKFFSIPKTIKRENVDVVIEPAHFGPLNLPESIKRVTVIHDLTPIILPALHRFASSLLQKIFLPHILRETDLIIANSDNTKKDIERVYPFTVSKVRRIYPGKSNAFKPDTRFEVLEDINLNAPFFVCVGTIEPRKNHIQLLSAFADFKKTNESDVKLLIVGGRGWKSSAFEKSYEDHPYKDDIIMPGYISAQDLPSIYTNAIALVYPSVYEGFGFPVLEAMSCGTRAIIPKNSSLPEVGGEFADYYDEGERDSLVRVMAKVFDERSSDVEIESKLIKWSANFSWNKFAIELFSELEKL